MFPYQPQQQNKVRCRRGELLYAVPTTHKIHRRSVGMAGYRWTPPVIVCGVAGKTTIVGGGE